MANHPKTITLDSFSGIDNVNPPERTKQKFLKEANNVDIRKDGSITLRQGFTSFLSGDFRDAFIGNEKLYCINNSTNELIKVNYDSSTDTIVSNISDSKISYLNLNGNIYYMSDNDSGIIEYNDTRRNWGIQQPSNSFSIEETVGILNSGRYQIAVSFVASDGRESGLSLSNYFDLSNDNKGILITNIPQSDDSTVNRIRLYCSSKDGETLYFIKDLYHGTTSTTINSLRENMNSSMLFNLSPPPNGHLISYFNDRVYIASEEILYYSNPFMYEHFNLKSSYMYFPERIKLIMPVENGIWIASDKIYFLSGKTPENMSLYEKEPVRAVEGSAQKISGAYIFINNTPLGYKWLFTTDKGIFVAFNDGVLLNLTERSVSFPKSNEGSSLFMQKNGINKYISLLKDQDQSTQNVGVGDLVTAEVVRNGVIINE